MDSRNRKVSAGFRNQRRTNIQILERSISQEVKNSHHVSIFKTLRPHKNKTQKQNVSLRGTFFLFVRSSNAFFFFFSSSCIRSSKTSYYTPSVYSRERGAYHRIVRERPKSLKKPEILPSVASTRSRVTSSKTY